ncbi:hypothetical protein JK386_17480 [Nocardioides sp. zg-536]|uniref:Type VII secretion integral membrane protein EccD n=1 Tax=Nocardioides faecalis TaxID=2803858 RepID=A0A938YBP5_9ACTN|nr:hypothetical protein [Nocardioides faecalis]MBM9461693.1 hypothetical protein [Nocardioides faecalis]MBS4752109.1 hypothetical protein [Nocardioides faecalis]QVI59081.1 hypothetical protein KG111_01405 [Nocardioides faecalis]
MSGTTSRPPTAGALVAVTVHGPYGVLDLTVPADAALGDVAAAYAAETGLRAPLPLLTRTGAPLPMATTLAAAGLASGSVLVAVDPALRPPGSHRRDGAREDRGRGPAPGPAAGTWLLVAVGVAVAAAWASTRLPAEDRLSAVAVLLLAAVVGCLPVGRIAEQRVLTAPAFAAAAVFAAVWDPLPERLPMVLGAAGLAAAVCAAVGRALAALGSSAEEGLRTWMVVGSGWFVVAGLGVLLGLAPQVVWAVLLLVAVLGARFVPEVAVDVPDSYLLDLERLAVTAWSARERPTGRRGRIVVPRHAVDTVAARGTRLLGAASVAILVTSAIAAPLLLATATLPLDRVGARCLVGFGGAALLLAARSYRHVLARRMLRLAGVVPLACLALVLLDVAPLGAGTGRIGSAGLLAGAAVVLAGVLVTVAVLVGRGWRSAWWSRRAEVAEALCGSFAVGALVVAVGLFRHLWEVTG